MDGGFSSPNALQPQLASDVQHLYRCPIDNTQPCGHARFKEPGGQRLASKPSQSQLCTVEVEHQSRPPTLEQDRHFHQHEGTSHAGRSLPHGTTGLTGGSAHLGLLQVRKVQSGASKPYEDL
ncbi:hypothetical protein P7K49_014386 [Saguinus oedipus]|uniref:Uncharacterized protein n=1 Tax=Saguinus oedipus TaxID=9490 RepID=A0ABQ9VJA2_SAGOE|nr:hypothetical protein P7K49_014386 [Saguinus oedipus]